MLMDAHPISLQHVWKAYRLGETHDSLRDAIPSLMRRLLGRGGRAAPRQEFIALRDVSFHVAKGETLGLIGPNGAGKSTILKLLSKIAKQSRGTIAVRGRLAALIELGGGFHSDLSGAENIYLQGTMLGLSLKQVRKLFDSIVDFSELEEFIDTPVKRYSSGMIVRLGFAIAAHVNPEVLLLDEVLAVGDLAFQQKSFKRILELKQRGTTMIFISHDLDAVQKLCDRVIQLEKGGVVDEGAPADVIQRYRDRVQRQARGNGALAAASSGEFTLLDIRLLDGEGTETDTFEMGSALRLEIRYAATRAIEHPDVQIGIDRIDGLNCHGISSRQQGGVPRIPAGTGTITVSYPKVALLPNAYSVSIEVHEDRALVPLAEAARCRSFQVSAACSEQGVVHLDHAWTVSAES